MFAPVFLWRQEEVPAVEDEEELFTSGDLSIPCSLISPFFEADRELFFFFGGGNRVVQVVHVITKDLEASNNSKTSGGGKNVWNFLKNVFFQRGNYPGFEVNINLFVIGVLESYSIRNP